MLANTAYSRSTDPTATVVLAQIVCCCAGLSWCGGHQGHSEGSSKAARGMRHPQAQAVQGQDPRGQLTWGNPCQLLHFALWDCEKSWMAVVPLVLTL